MTNRSADRRRSARPSRGLWYVAVFMSAMACEGRDVYRVGIAVGGEGRRAARIAAAEINAAGGINGHPLELVQSADASDASAQAALRTAEQFAAQPGLLAVVGHANSGASLAASQVYNSRGIVQIAPTSTAPIYSQAGPFSFRLVGSDVHQAAYIAQQVLAEPTHARVAVVYVNDDYGRGLLAPLLDELRTHRVVPVYEGPYADDERFAADHDIVRALAFARPDVLVWIGRPTQFATLSPTLRRVLPRLSVLASDGFGGFQLDVDSTRRYEGVRYVRVVDLEGGGAAMTTLRKRYAAEGGGSLTDQAALTYDSVKLLAEAMRQVGPDGGAIRDWLSSLGAGRPAFIGVTGPVAFRNGGDRITQFRMERVGGPNRVGPGAIP